MKAGASSPLSVAAAALPGKIARESEAALARGLSHFYQVLDH